MTYRVFLKQTTDKGYTAMPLMFPDCVAVGTTRDEALANLKTVLTARLAEGEFATVEIGEPEHAWLKGAGVFSDDPTVEDFLAEIEAYRREVDEAAPLRADLATWGKSLNGLPKTG